MTERWKPNVTVASILEKDGRYLLVEELTAHGPKLNNPAGHLELGESLTRAVIRETLEETAWHFVPQALVGVYLSRTPPGSAADVTYVRFAFCGRLSAMAKNQTLDEGILGTHWLTLEEVQASRERHRSPLVLQGILDHRAGKRLPLDAVWIDPSSKIEV